MSYAVNKVEDGGEIVIQGEYSYGETGALGNKGKAITITGGTLNISATKDFNINGPVVLGSEENGLTVKVNTDGNVYANGNDFEVKENVVFDKTLKGIYGGSSAASVDSTHMVLKAGSYGVIYGGGPNGGVNGDTYLFVGGNVNEGSKSYKHDNLEERSIYGGSFQATVQGNTYVVFDGDKAEAGRIYGAGMGSKSSVQGTTNVTISNGKVYSVFGGSSNGSSHSTNVLVEGGTVAQIFGGSEGVDLEGDTYVRVTGGTVTRRIYGGCYGQLENNHTYHVKGNSTLRIEKVNYTCNDDATPTEYMISACSRTETNHADENAILEIPQDLYNSLDSYIGGTVRYIFYSWTIPDFDTKSFI